MQACFWARAGHATPPWAAATLTVRERFWEPAAQVTEQADHEVQRPTTQLMGQASTLHLRFWPSAGHTTPPKATATLMPRERVWEPPPQVRLQVDQADQGLMTQSTGQAGTLQACFWARTGHATPPWATATLIPRERLWEPPPQVRLQVDQADQADTTQLTGQAATLQACFSARPGQALPPNRTLVVMVRLRV